MPDVSLGEVSLHYESRGAGFPVLGIMGFALDQRFWAATIPAVTRGNRFVTFDNRGIGRSTGPLVSSIDDMAQDAVALLDHLDIDRAIVFGVSMGGAIAQRLVLGHPERVESLVLGVTWARPIEFMRRQTDLARRIIADGTEDLVDASLLWMFTPRFFEIGAEAIDRMTRAFMAESGPELADAAVLNAQLDAITKHDCLAELGSITCPTLVFGGRMDMMVPYFASEEVAAAIPGARLATFESGHGLMMEEMDAFNARLAAFLEEVSPRGAE